MTPIIDVKQLTKEFHPPQRRRLWKRGNQNSTSAGVNKIALYPADFSVMPGEMIGFIGPNGAGKSTTIKMLTGILHPSGGDASVLNMRPWEQRVALSYHIGTVFGQKSQLWYHLPPRDTFLLMAKVYGLSGTDFRRRRDELVERFGLGPLMDVPVRKLSLGERMKSEIALSFLHHPKILFLDEPTIGLDVVVKQTIRELIRERNREEGVTVFLTSHDATDIESLCNRVLVINHGHLLFDGATSHLVRRFLHYKEVTLHVDTEDLCLMQDGVEIHPETAGVFRLVVDVSKVQMDQLLADVFSRHAVKDVSIREPSMEEIIRAIYTSPEEVTLQPS